MSEHGLFSGYAGVAPQHHRAANLPRPVLTRRGLHSISTLPGVVHSAKPSSAHMPNVEKIVGVPQKHANIVAGMGLEKVKPSATKSTPGMIKLELR